jgi:hypothetical protein
VRALLLVYESPFMSACSHCMCSLRPKNKQSPPHQRRRLNLRINLDCSTFVWRMLRVYWRRVLMETTTRLFGAVCSVNACRVKQYIGIKSCLCANLHMHTQTHNCSLSLPPRFLSPFLPSSRNSESENPIPAIKF